MNILAAALSVLAVVAVTPVANAVEPPLPNLVPLPPDKVYIDAADPVDNPDVPQPQKAIRFATTIFNDADTPLDLLFAPGSTDDLPTNGRDALQCVAFAGPVCSERKTVGRAEYEAPFAPWYGEAQWAMRESVHYALVPATPDGMPDFDAEPIATSSKESTCWYDWHRREDAAPTDAPLYLVCNGSRQGLSPRHGLTHLKTQAGQQLVVDGLPSGVYGIVVTVNPHGVLVEASLWDNRSWVVVEVRFDCECHHDTLVVLREGVS